MDWGLLLHCAALMVTLGRTLKSGKWQGTLVKHVQVAAGRVGWVGLVLVWIFLT